MLIGMLSRQIILYKYSRYCKRENRTQNMQLQQQTSGAAVELLPFRASPGFVPDYRCCLYILPVITWLFAACSGFLPHSICLIQQSTVFLPCICIENFILLAAHLVTTSLYLHGAVAGLECFTERSSLNCWYGVE